MVRKNLELKRGQEGKTTPFESGGLTTGGTHDRPLRGDSEIVRGRKSKQCLGEDSHQVGRFYWCDRMEVKRPVMTGDEPISLLDLRMATWLPLCGAGGPKR
jgi:hypothetical protein